MPVGTGHLADYPNQIPKYWETSLFAEAEKMTFWNRFEGAEGSGAAIVRKDDLTKKPGDTIYFDAVLALTGVGDTSTTQLTEGNEDKLVLRQRSFTVGPLKKAVRWDWLVEQEVTHDHRAIARTQLAKWLAGRLDDRLFNEVTGGGTVVPTAHKFVCSADHTTRATMDTDDFLTLDYITKMKAQAQNLLLEPMRLDDGVEVFGLVIHPYTEMKLKLQDTYKQAMQYAEVRGKENPLFKGASAIWDGVVIYTSQRVPRDATTPFVADNIFFGQQLAARGYGMYPTWVERDFSYGEESGIATRLLVGEKLITFDLNATETSGDATDDFMLGGMLVLSTAPTS